MNTLLLFELEKLAVSIKRKPRYRWTGNLWRLQPFQFNSFMPDVIGWPDYLYPVSRRTDNGGW